MHVMYWNVRVRVRLQHVWPQTLFLVGVLLLLFFALDSWYHHRREEIRNLRLETANRENQLGTLRAQLNPHFMFNALNGIRAMPPKGGCRSCSNEEIKAAVDIMIARSK